MLSNKATIEYLDADNQVVETKTCWRSVPEIIRTIGADLAQRKDGNARVTVLADDGSKALVDEAGNRTDYVIAAGPVMDVIKALIDRAIHPNMVMGEFQNLFGFMSDRSNLKGILVTAVFGDASVGGFGMLSTTSELTDTDIVTLVEASSNQVQLMKDEMKRKRPELKFPSDNAGLILPGRFK